MPWIVSSSVRPLNRPHLEELLLGGERRPRLRIGRRQHLLRQPELFTRRFQTSRSFSSSMRFELIACTSFAVTLTTLLPRVKRGVPWA